MGDMSKCKHGGFSGYCDQCDPTWEADLECENWTINKQAEHMMNGMTAKDALQKAMEDWHTYKAVN